MVPKLKNIEIRNTIKKFQANTSNNTPEGYNMTPNVSEEDAKKVRDKYDATYMKGDGEIKTWNEGQPNIIGSAGSLGAIGAGGIKLLSLLGKKGWSNIKSLFTKPKVAESVLPLGKGVSTSQANVGARMTNNIFTKERLGKIAEPPRKIGEFERRAAEYLNRRVSKGTATADDIKQLNIYNKRTSFGTR
jgi:hypothetical protein